MQRRPRLLTEQEHQKKAFEVYATSGEKRSYDRVARELKVAVSTVKLWANSFDWKQRLREKEAAEVRQAADRVLTTNAQTLDRNLKIVRGALLRTAKDISQGKVKPQMGDLDRLIRLEEHLTSQKPETAEFPELHDPVALRRRALLLIAMVVDRMPDGRQLLMGMWAERPSPATWTGADVDDFHRDLERRASPTWRGSNSASSQTPEEALSPVQNAVPKLTEN